MKWPMAERIMRRLPNLVCKSNWKGELIRFTSVEGWRYRIMEGSAWRTAHPGGVGTTWDGADSDYTIVDDQPFLEEEVKEDVGTPPTGGSDVEKPHSDFELDRRLGNLEDDVQKIQEVLTEYADDVRDTAGNLGNEMRYDRG